MTITNEHAKALTGNWKSFFGGQAAEYNQSPGVMVLKKISPNHRRIIALHFRGVSNNDIAVLLNYHFAYVSMILNQPLVKELRAKFAEEMDNEMQSLYGSAVDAVRKGLNDEDPKTALLAVDRFMKSTGKYQRFEDTGKGNSAEGIIAKMMETLLASDQVRKLPNRGNASRIIDITPEQVETTDGREQVEVPGSEGPDHTDP